MASDFLNTVQDIRGTGTDINVVGNSADAGLDVSKETGGIWQRLKDKEALIDETNTSVIAINSSISTINDNVIAMNDNVNTKSADVDTKSADVVIKYTDFAGADGLGGKFATFEGHHAEIDLVKMEAVADNQVNINAVSDNQINIDAVNANKINIDTVAEDKVNIDSVATNIADVIGTNVNKVNIDSVATNIADVIAVNANKANIDTLAEANNLANIIRVADDLNSMDVNGIADITIVADDLVKGAGVSDILVVSAELQADQKLDVIYNQLQPDQKLDYLFDDLGRAALTGNYDTFDAQTNSYIRTSINASSAAIANVTDAELFKWETEAFQRTSNSFATESWNEPVKIWTSFGDGTFESTDTNPIQYSAYHWKMEATQAAGDPATAALTFTNKTINSISNYVAANTGVMDVVATGAAINAGEVVGINGFDASGTTVRGAKVNGTRAVGIATIGIGDGTHGLITTSGLATGLNTSGMSGLVYSNGAGGFTTTKPSSKYQSIGFVAKQHDTDGAIYVEVSDWSFEQEINYVNRTSSYSASDKDYMFCDTQTSGAFTITLPSSPTIGANVVLLDVNGTFDTAGVTVARNGSTIMGLAEDLVLDVENTTCRLIYTGSDWRIA